MNDSFSLLAKSIRQNKINKEELLNNLKKVSEGQTKKDLYIKKLLLIQKCFRGYLFRKKYSLLLEEININTVIDYLYEKKKKRIHQHKDEIISFFVTKYINKRKRKKNNFFLEQYKIHCSNLIKARLKGILVRKKIRKKLEIIRNAKKIIIKHIMALRTILILKSNTIQNLLCDIAKIKYQLKNCKNEKMKELENKLNKNINLFYDTYFYAKDNCNWGNDQKNIFFKEKCYKQYFEIINSDKTDEKNQNGGNSNMYLLNKNNMDNNYKYFNSSKRLRNQNLNSSKIIPKNLSESLNSKKYANNERVFEFKLEEKENILYQNKKTKYRNSLNINNGFNIRKGNTRYISDKTLKQQINDIDLNNINNNLFYSSKTINGFVPNEEMYPISMNTYYQMDEREINPLKSKDILNCKNPFGLREVTYKKSNTFKEITENIFSETIPFIKRNSTKIINRDERPICGNKINYNELFGKDGELMFDGDPFGGAKQFETKKDKITNMSKSSKIKKKPVYDARKAIEEAKLKEEKKEKNEKEKSNKFREFVKEMKKINCNNIKGEDLKLMKRFSENINFVFEEKLNGINIYEPKNMKENATKKREKSANKSNTNQILRKKLHDLEKTPAPALNKKEIKSKVNCWFNKESTKNKEKKENYLDKKLLELNLEMNKINNSFNINKYFEEKEEKMKKFRNIPFIKKDDKYVNYIKNIDMIEYDNLLNDIDKEYKILK